MPEPNDPTQAGPTDKYIRRATTRYLHALRELTPCTKEPRPSDVPDIAERRNVAATLALAATIEAAGDDIANIIPEAGKGF